MAFDGLMMAAVTAQLKGTIEGGAVSKLAMPEKDELLITIRNNSNNYRLLISAGASLPLIYLTDENRQSPLTAPAFCMLLRKYLGGARIINVRQEGLERIIIIDFEHLDDLGDLSVKHLIFEMMGKHSNIIFTNASDTIIDSIKRVPSSVSSIREVLPGREYAFPTELEKSQPFDADIDSFSKICISEETEIYKIIYKNYAGISPASALELCFRSGIDGEAIGKELSQSEISRLFACLKDMTTDVRSGSFKPEMVLRHKLPVDFSAVHMSMYENTDYEIISYDSVSKLLEAFYSSREIHSRIRQKSADLRKIVTNLLERSVKKYDLQHKQLLDCEGKDKYKVYGDLLNTYGYSLQGGENSFSCENYYDDNHIIAIPLDSHKTASENAKKYYDRYAKLRRTEHALNDEIVKTENDIEHLSGILQSIDTSASESDLAQIRQELIDFGYIKRTNRNNLASKPVKSQPLHIVSSDGFDIYIGKNNYQNEEVTFKIADSNDMWFHAKGVPGSHVVVKCNAKPNELPDRVYEEAASLAAFYSKNSGNDKVEVDYTLRKNLKRTSGGAPGFVIYHTNYSVMATPRAKI